ncbi:hypothetical protein F0231_03365 [Vibrio sp. RE86]|uniref:hypothetical protein n=1 Tax=Vibrio sp. RE86 TaxID=2607605 RepID=UPI0014933853|nr:hypothetical protein [Vibrio sp. RE86]NOH78776.1 hypothetical protein [Vibrio sp. RE86]
MENKKLSQVQQLLEIYNQRAGRYDQRIEDFKVMRAEISAVEEPRVRRNERNIKIAIVAAVLLVIASIVI